MDIYDLQKKINIAFNEEARFFVVRGHKQGAPGSMIFGLQNAPNNGWATEGEIPCVIKICCYFVILIKLYVRQISVV